MNRALREETADAIVQIVKRLEPNASFRRILVEARKRGQAKWDRTLRKYLDHLVHGQLLERHLREVGSVHPMELYHVKSEKARIHVGLSILALHGFNWESEKHDIVEVASDTSALVRAKPTRIGSHEILAACLEDCIAYEFERDAREERGTAELLAGLLATTRLDLPYLFERADRIGVGQGIRVLFRKVEQTFTAATSDSDARAFVTCRTTFLQLARQYSAAGMLQLVAQRGKGSAGMKLAEGLSEAVLVNAAAKQLGITG